MKSKRLLAATAVTTMLATSVVPTSVLANTKVEKEENTNKNADALHDQVMEVTVHRDEAKEAMDAAKKTADEKMPMLEEAKTEADDKKAALDALNEQLQRDLETEMAKQQNAIDESNAQLEQLNKNKEELNEQLKTAQESLNQAQESLKEKQTALKAAEEAAKEATEEKTMQAHAAVEAAKHAVEAAQMDYNQAVTQRDQIKEQLMQLEKNAANLEKEVETATQQLTAAKEAQKQADMDLKTAQRNYDQYHAEDAMTAVTAELETTNKEYEAASKMVMDQEKTVAEAQSAYQKAKSELDAKRASLVAAEEKVKDNQKNYETLSDELTKTTKAKEEAERAVERTNNERERLKKEAADARKIYEQALSNINTRQLEIVRARAAFNQLDRKIKKAEETMQNKSDMRSFLQFAKHTDSVKFLDELLELKQSSGEKWKDRIHLENNGMTLTELEQALTHIEESNAIRRNLKLPEFKVSSMLMLTSWFNSHYAKYDHFDHSKEVKINHTNAAENLTTATTDMFKGWYEKEKELFDGYVKEGKYPGLATMDAYEVSTKYSNIYPSIGHYLNLVRPSHKVTGFATTEGTSSQTFWQEDGLKDTMTVSEYRAKMEEYKKAMAKKDVTEDLKKKHAAAKARYDQLTKETAALRKQYDTNKAIFDQKNTALQTNLETYNTSKATIADAKQKLTDLKTKVSDANKVLTDAKTKKEQLQSDIRAKTLKIDGVYKTLFDAKELLETKEAAKAAQLAAKEQAETKLKDLEAAKKESQRMLDAAKQAKTEKEQLVKAAVTALDLKKAEKGKIDSQIQDTKKTMQEKEMMVKEKADTLDKKEKEQEAAFAVIEHYNELLDTLSKSEEAIHLQNNKLASINGKLTETDKRIRMNAAAVQDVEKELATKQGRKDLLDHLNKEFTDIKAGMSGLLLNSDDAFVKAFQANYPKVWVAFNEYDKAQKALAMLEKESASDQEAYAMAKKAYQDADMKLNALLDRMNKELNSEVEQENKKEMQKDPSGVQTAAANDSAVWALSFASAAGAWAVIDRKRKAVK